MREWQQSTHHGEDTTGKIKMADILPHGTTGKFLAISHIATIPETQETPQDCFSMLLLWKSLLLYPINNNHKEPFWDLKLS
ncbi:unnamed protein product [Caretta caretta]